MKISGEAVYLERRSGMGEEATNWGLHGQVTAGGSWSFIARGSLEASGEHPRERVLGCFYTRSHDS